MYWGVYLAAIIYIATVATCMYLAVRGVKRK